MPKNNAQLNSQWLYHKYSVIYSADNVIFIDNSKMPAEAYERGLIGNLILKIPLLKGQHISNANIDGKNIAGYYEERGCGHIILPLLDISLHKLYIQIGSLDMPIYILNDGAYNVLSFDIMGNEYLLEIELYGMQLLKIKMPFNPVKIISSSSNVKIVSHNYNLKDNLFVCCLIASSVQGDVTTIKLIPQC